MHSLAIHGLVFRGQVKAGTRKPVVAEAWFLRGRIAERQDDTTLARKAYQSALELNPDLHRAASNLARLLCSEPQNLAEAMRLAQAAVTQAPENPFFLNSLAHVQIAHQDHEGAIKSLQSAIRVQPENRQWRENLATALAAAGREDEAEQIRSSLKSDETL